MEEKKRNETCNENTCTAQSRCCPGNYIWLGVAVILFTIFIAMISGY